MSNVLSIFSVLVFKNNNNDNNNNNINNNNNNMPSTTYEVLYCNLSPPTALCNVRIVGSVPERSDHFGFLSPLFSGTRHPPEVCYLPVEVSKPANQKSVCQAERRRSILNVDE